MTARRLIYLTGAAPVSSVLGRRWFFVLTYGADYPSRVGVLVYQRVYWCPCEFRAMWENRRTPTYALADWFRDNLDAFRILGDAPTPTEVDDVCEYILTLNTLRKPRKRRRR